MGYPKNYQTQCVFQKNGMILSPEDIIKDLIESLEKNQQKIIYKTEKRIEFYYETKPIGIEKYWRGGTLGIKIPVKCSIEFTEKDKSIIFDFKARLLNGVLIWNIGLSAMFLIFTNTMPKTENFLIFLAVFGLVILFTNLIAYVNISGHFDDFVKYRLFWKYLNKKK